MGPFLNEVTGLLQRLRLAHPVDGLWEAADLQWWSRRGAPLGYEFRRHGETAVGAAVLTRFASSIGLAFIGDCPDGLSLFDANVSALDLPVSVEILPSEVALRERLEARGFVVDGSYDTRWRPAATPATRPLPEGYLLVDRVSFRDGPHWMSGRNGDDVEAGLQAAGLYSAPHDLAVLAPDGSVAGYALFWPDPVTGVGLLEPMRVEAAHGGRGIGGALIAEGLGRLAATGCTRFKVSVEVGNTPAERLYAGAGFVSTTPTLSLVRPAA